MTVYIICSKVGCSADETPITNTIRSVTLSAKKGGKTEEGSVASAALAEEDREESINKTEIEGADGAKLVAT